MQNDQIEIIKIDSNEDRKYWQSLLGFEIKTNEIHVYRSKLIEIGYIDGGNRDY